jgi:hypothetical protein
MVLSIGVLVMKRHFVLVIILIIIGLFIAFSAAAHPYDDPLTFVEHKTDAGLPINIKSCDLQATNIFADCF